MKANLHSIISDVGTPGRLLAFCDETDLTFEPTSTMVGDLHLYGGLIVRSETYAPLGENLANYLIGIGQTEFHGTEIINPKPSSSWKMLGYGARLEALRYVCAAVAQTDAIFVYARICKSQYAEMLEDASGAIEADYKAAAKKVFLRSVADYLAGSTPAVVFIDRDKNSPGPSLIEFDGGGTLVGGGAISCKSEGMPGLQLADMVAYAVGRFLRRRDKIVATDPEHYEPFDAAIMEFVGKLDGRLHEVLNSPPDLPQVA